MKTGDTVYYFSLAIDFKKDEVRFKAVENKVIGANDKRVVIDDERFTVLDFKQSYINSTFKKVSGHHFNLTSYYDEIRVDYYSPNNSEKIAKRVMKKWATDYMYEKFGRYTGKQFLLDKI